MRIALITCHFPPDSIGGGQVQSYRLAQALGRTNDVAVFTRAYGPGLPSEERVGDVRMLRRRVSRIPLLRSVLDFVRGVAFVGRCRSRYDIFLSFHVQLAALIAVVGGKLFGVPATVSPRGKEDFDFRPWPKRLLQRFIYVNATAVLLQSEMIRAEFLTAAKEFFRPRTLDALNNKTHIFPNVIGPQGMAQTVPREGRFKVLFVGRLARVKGVETLLRAIPLIGRPVEVTLVGDGPLRSELERLAEGLPVRFVGEVAFGEVGGFLVSSQVLVLPSLSENLPNVVLEALAAGLPVVASRLGAVPELIRDGVNGYLVEPGDAQGIAARLRQLCDSEEHCRELGRGAMESVRPYTEAVLVPALEHELRSIIERHAHTS